MTAAENDFAAKVAVNAVTEVFKLTLNSFGKTHQWLKYFNKRHDLFDRAAKQYAKRIEERYNNMKIFGMNKPVPLKDIFTRVNILEKITAQQLLTPKELEQLFDKDRRTFGVPKESKTGMQVAKDIHKFILLGKPGSGKTTYLKYIALQAIDRKLGKNLIPIFITLKDFADSDDDLMDYIVEQFDICQIPDAKPFIERILEQGHSIILFDGLDEVNQEKFDGVIRQIIKFSEKYSDNRFIVSCRIAAYNYCFEKFTDVELADFDDKQIGVFVNNWFGRGTKKAKLAKEEIDAEPQIRELASNPLLLTLLCLTFDENMTFPQNRAELYGDAVNALLRKWDTTRGIKRDEIYKNLAVKRKEDMLSRVATETFEKDEYFIPQKKLEGHIKNYIEHLPSTDPAEVDIDSEVILQAIEAQHGIFVERAKGIYSFSHLTFQEFFTARYIVENATKGTLKQLVDNLGWPKWHQVIILTCSMLPEADDFFSLMVDKLEERIASEIEYCRGKSNLSEVYINFLIRLKILLTDLVVVTERRTEFQTIQDLERERSRVAVEILREWKIIGGGLFVRTRIVLMVIEIYDCLQADGRR